MRPNRLRELWKSGKPALNGWCQLPDSISAEVMAHQGWDCVTVDLQHSAVTEVEAVTMLQAISTTDAVPMVRTPWNEPGVIMRLLDAGAYGIICPMVNNRADAEAFVAACRYPPDGIRSNGPYRALMYGGADYQAHANTEIVTFAMIETQEAMANVDEIAATPGLDGLYIGPSDLAMAHGEPPVLDHFDGPIVPLIARIREAAHTAGKVAGLHGASAEYAIRMISEGFNLVTPTSDIRLVAAGAAQMVADIKAG
ncbi:MAG: aldolase/citrate lyase family protein [Alphaproteobacteria bacterium]|nr:aldolase/citrate lyase family protein [Alphaproteobacteria bacterium]